ncbi:MAG TPA: lysylphosphatidylglycerol synthase transmembrane domain-containing protein [Bryobacteraceae bacterium]|jgi:hypothetical protein
MDIPKTRRRRIPSWLPQVLGYCLSAVCLLWALRNYNFHELPAAIRSLDWKWVALGVGCDLAVYLTHAWRWNTLLGPVARLGYWRTVQSIYIGLFANEVLPLRVGELIRCYLLAHWNDLRISLIFSSAAVERLFDGFYMLAAFFLTASFVRRIPEKLTILVDVLGVFVLIGACVLVWVIRYKQHAHLIAAESRWASTLRHIVEGLHLMGNWRTMGATALISGAYLALQVVSYWALMKAFLLDLSFLQAGGVLAIVRFATAVPNAPGNVGVFQLACVTALALFDVERTDAQTFAIVLFFALSMPLLIGGAIATALTGVNIRQIREHARRRVEAAPQEDEELV